MNQPQLPAYLQNRQTRKLVADATAGLGASLPAHISTEGTVFTLVDAAGTKQLVTFQGPDGKAYAQPFLDVCVVDINAATGKRYYDQKYSPDASAPPTCWSANGDVPSNDSVQKQARTCAECKLNERGSAVSEFSGASIKACRDEKWLALAVPHTGMDTIFRFTLTPGSFKNWRAYVEQFKNGPIDISDVVTRFEWVGQSQPNTLKFSAQSYIDEKTAALAERALAAKATDALVGRDQAVARIAGPAPQAALPQPSLEQQAAQGGQAASPLAPTATASNVGFQSTSSAPASTVIEPPVQAASPSEAPAPGRRRRNAAAPAAPAQQQAPLTAPFPTSPPPANGAAPGPSFGIQPGVTPDPALSATLAQFFPGNKQ